MKYGHDVPRWWIPDFHTTHKSAIPNKEYEEARSTKTNQEIRKEHYELKRRSRQIEQRRQLVRPNKDIRVAQKCIAILFPILGLITSGPIGFGIGTCIGLALLAFRLEL